jgi:hypothetical protein
MSRLDAAPVIADHAAEPQLNSQERLISTVYVAMGALTAAFLAATSAASLL